MFTAIAKFGQTLVLILYTVTLSTVPESVMITGAIGTGVMFTEVSGFKLYKRDFGQEPDRMMR